MKPCSCSLSCKLGTVTGVGAFLCILGSILLVYWPMIFERVLNTQLALSPTSKSYDLWLETPIPMYIDFYLFNWTNPSDLKSDKPVLHELGPYVFKESRHKVVKEWNANNTVTFLQNRTWVFEPSLSNGSLDDLITTINIPAVTAAFAIRHKSELMKIALNNAMKFIGTKLVVKKKVREFLFDGYADPLLDLASLLPPELVPVTIPFDKFGWFYTRNGSATYDGVFNMFTGKGDIAKFGQIDRWDYVNSTSFYPSYCGNVNGSAGEFFPPKRDKSTLGLFSPDVCRTLELNYKENIKVDGISGYRFWGDDTMFNNKTTNPDNWCFCPSGECPPNGAIDVSTCKWGAPAFISFPHFYHADPSYRQAVDGMKPDQELHQMFIDVEPRTGIPLQVAASLQINILVQPMKDYYLFRGIDKIYFPAVWFKQRARIDDEIGPQVKMILSISSVGTISSLVFLGIGVAALVITGVYYSTLKCRNDDEILYPLPTWKRWK